MQCRVSLSRVLVNNHRCVHDWLVWRPTNDSRHVVGWGRPPSEDLHDRCSVTVPPRRRHLAATRSRPSGTGRSALQPCLPPTRNVQTGPGVEREDRWGSSRNNWKLSVSVYAVTSHSRLTVSSTCPSTANAVRNEISTFKSLDLLNVQSVLTMIACVQ